MMKKALFFLFRLNLNGSKLASYYPTERGGLPSLPSKQFVASFSCRACDMNIQPSDFNIKHKKKSSINKSTRRYECHPQHDIDRE